VDTLSLTYAELADRLGIEREAARQLVKRKRWPKWKGNDGQLKVSIPEEALSNRSSSGARPEDESGADPVDNRIEAGLLPVLTRHIERLEAQLEEAQKRAGERDEIAKQRDLLVAQIEALRNSHTSQIEALNDSTKLQVDALRAALAAAERDRDRWHEVATTKPEPAPVERKVVVASPPFVSRSSS
jgi:hypothetical protein